MLRSTATLSPKTVTARRQHSPHLEIASRARSTRSEGAGEDRVRNDSQPVIKTAQFEASKWELERLRLWGPLTTSDGASSAGRRMLCSDSYSEKMMTLPVSHGMEMAMEVEMPVRSKAGAELVWGVDGDPRPSVG
ncbi:hypothetical protein LZ554_009253 [Drepanopeziza brunnea f. sp. 'monogermtubi']|nr:hypothetical protein LZ554_009253 [Drepanopeziza brunnea f. sp. 'monogermtubi']